jgi:23S rRNA (adenine1618-N6)-methyltransferase
MRPTPPATKDALHPRSRHRHRYDFPALIASLPALRPFVARNAYGDESVDFADPLAVKTLNRALLRHHYQVAEWDIPPGFLCPPIPGRVDYLHYAADLLAESAGGTIPRGATVQVLDLGVGANCIYPLLGHREYDWRFVGSEIDAQALVAAQRNVTANRLDAVIACRRQADPQRFFTGVVLTGERFELSLCNPPFHGSRREAQAGTQRKLTNLGRASTARKGAAPVLNFGGRDAELWCPGGEGEFVSRMIAESAAFATRCRWFTSLVAKEANLPRIQAALKAIRPQQTRIIPMAQGQKRSRIVAWSFLTPAEHRQWRTAPR